MPDHAAMDEGERKRLKAMGGLKKRLDAASGRVETRGTGRFSATTSRESPSRPSGAWPGF